MAFGDKTLQGEYVFIEGADGSEEKYFNSLTLREQGTVYHDVPNDYMYVVFGEDGDWYAVRYRDGDEVSDPQTGTKATTLVELQALSYA